MDTEERDERTGSALLGTNLSTACTQKSICLPAHQKPEHSNAAPNLLPHTIYAFTGCEMQAHSAEPG